MARMGGLVLVMLLLPVASAATLDADLRPEDPVRFDGGLSPVPSTGDVLFMTPHPDGVANQTIVEVHGVDVVLHRWVVPPLGPSPWPTRPALPGALSGYSPATKSVVDLTVHLATIEGSPQLLIEGGADPTEELKVTGAGCMIQRADGVRRFPEGVAGETRALHEASPSGRLDANCSASAVVALRPARVAFFGVGIYLVEDGEVRFVRTGAFEEPDPSGLGSRRVVQMVSLRRPEAGGASYDAPSQVDLRAGSLLGVGLVRTGSADGRVHWGPLAQEGRVEPIEATGAFLFGPGDASGITIAGETLGDPPVVARATAAAPIATRPVLVAVGATLAVLALAVGLFARIRSSKALDHDRRRSILELARAEPGIEVNRLARSLGYPWANVDHHLRVLVRCDLVRVHRVGGRTAVFPANEGFRGRETHLALLRRPSVARVHGLLLARPGLDQSSLARDLGFTQQNASLHLRRLVDVGLARVETIGGRRTYHGEPITS